MISNRDRQEGCEVTAGGLQSSSHIQGRWQESFQGRGAIERSRPRNITNKPPSILSVALWACTHWALGMYALGTHWACTQDSPQGYRYTKSPRKK